MTLNFFHRCPFFIITLSSFLLLCYLVSASSAQSKHPSTRDTRGRGIHDTNPNVTTTSPPIEGDPTSSSDNRTRTLVILAPLTSLFKQPTKHIFNAMNIEPVQSASNLWTSSSSNNQYGSTSKRETHGSGSPAEAVEDSNSPAAGSRPSIGTQTDNNNYGVNIDPVKPSEVDRPVSVLSSSSIGEEGQGPNYCTCVPYFLCDSGRVVDDGAGVIDPRNKEPSKKEVPLDARLQPPYCGTYHVCCSEPETQTQQPYIPKCGIRNPGGLNSRILSPDVKGESDFGEWPWQAIILKEEQDKEGKTLKVFQCGATLIDSYHVLTAAHSVKSFDNPGSLIVRLGEWDTNRMTEFMPHEDYPVAEVIIHPSFNPKNLHNDIAIVKLAREVTFKPNIDSVCLPQPGQSYDRQCVTTGWGKNSYHGGQFSNILKEVNLPIIPHDDCQKALRKTRLGRNFRLHDSFLCAGGEPGRDACKGDGGGPLVCYRQDGTYSLVGIVSWGIDCGQAQPGVYVNVEKFLDWISSTTGRAIQGYWSAAANYSPQS
ncbi:phenoloxidase-activating factor 2-like [Brevipalpus obovatus]|uniref:phenoloxidase-activating factor 2-like n=1 Tax=Brevipalpus obovatus TaxID=246614 RepID=UPI003D9F722E